MATPDTSIFLVNRQTGEYTAEFSVRGTVSVSIQAQSLDAARAKADDMCEDEEFGLELDEADDVSRAYVRAKPAMFLVMRDGQAMQVSRLQEGDTPRQPTEHEARELARQALLESP